LKLSIIIVTISTMFDGAKSSFLWDHCGIFAGW
jgi:hypothetical protein